MAESPSSLLEPKSTSLIPVHEPAKSTPRRFSTEEQGGERQYIVGWEQPEDRDPENPLNWTRWQKWSIIGVLTFLSFLV